MFSSRKMCVVPNQKETEKKNTKKYQKNVYRKIYNPDDLLGFFFWQQTKYNIYIFSHIYDYDVLCAEKFCGNQNQNENVWC